MTPKFQTSKYVQVDKSMINLQKHIVLSSPIKTCKYHLIFQSIFPNSWNTVLFQWSSAAPQQLPLTQHHAAVPCGIEVWASERKCWYCIMWFNIRVYILYVDVFNQMISNVWLWGVIMSIESCFTFFICSGAQAYQASKGAISSSDSWAFLAAAMASRRAPKGWMQEASS